MNPAYLPFQFQPQICQFLQWDVANPRTTTPFPNNLFYMILHGRRNLILDDDLFAVFGVWFGLRWIFSDDLHYTREVQPRDLL